jgi:hypothetical protein
MGIGHGAEEPRVAGDVGEQHRPGPEPGRGGGEHRPRLSSIGGRIGVPAGSPRGVR